MVRPAVRPPPGRHQITVDGAHGGALIQAVARFHRPWADSPNPDEPELRFAVDCRAAESVGIDRTRTCRVDAERVGFRGHGMLVAEVGLPPGVTVDREALEAFRRPGGVSRFEVRPGRVIAYLWPQAGGTTFEVAFRSRIAMCAKATSSVLFDYYNPEARVTLAPDRFEISSADWPAPCSGP